MNRIIGIIEGEEIEERDDLSVHWRAKMAIDSDGIGPHHGDKTAQEETSLRNADGSSLNADVDKYIVVPPLIIHSVKGIVLGCQAQVAYWRFGRRTMAVVGDIGPHHKIGEASCSVATALGINPSPVDGGIDAHVIDYVIWPGTPAEVDGKKYELYPSSAV